MINYGFFHIPPPVHGSAIIGKIINDRIKINRTFNISLMSDSSEHKKFRLIKIYKVLKMVLDVFRLGIKPKDKVLYIPTNKGITLIRDFLLIFMLNIKGANIYCYYLNTGSKNNNFVFKYLHKYIVKNSNVILTSKLMISDLLGCKPKSLNFCGLGINCKPFKKKENSGQVSIGFFSNWYKSKGIIEFIEICRLNRNRKYTFYIAGQEGDFNFKDVLSKTKDFSNINVVGAIYGEKKFKFLNNLDILIYPSHDDTYPLSIIEAMSQGVYVISSNVGSITKIINNDITGKTFAIKNFVNEVSKFLNNSSSIKINKGFISKEYLKRFTEDIFINKLKRIVS